MKTENQNGLSVTMVILVALVAFVCCSLGAVGGWVIGRNAIQGEKRELERHLQDMQRKNALIEAAFREERMKSLKANVDDEVKESASESALPGPNAP